MADFLVRRDHRKLQIKSKKKYDLMYVSTFRPQYIEPNKYVFGVKYSDYIKKEIFLLKWLKDFSE